MLLVGMQQDATALENSLAGYENNKLFLPRDPAIPILGICPRKIKSHSLFHDFMYTNQT